MCEHFVARAAEPFRLDELWPFTERLERYGIAGFGWGAAWVEDAASSVRTGTPSVPRRPGRDEVGRVETTAALVHLRRPSKLSTLGIADTQPFDDPAGPLLVQPQRRLPRDPRRGGPATATPAGSTAGPTRRSARAGSRTAGTATAPVTLLTELHEAFGGQANLATIEVDGSVAAYAGNTENPVFTFRLGRIGIASTGIYSLDRSLFRFVAPEATERRLVRVGDAVALDRNGGPPIAS